MSSEGIASLCRICLENGATYLIFREVKKENSIHSKLSKCFNEKIEDIEGYPRKICLTCKDTLEIVYDFINKFKESHKILEEGFINLKCETEGNSNIEPDQLAEIEIELKTIKSEQKTFLDSLEDTNQLIKFFQPLDDGRIEENINQTVKVEKKLLKKDNKYDATNRTGKVASSILEGEFAWTGENWCLKSTILKIPKDKVKYRRRNTRLKLPRKHTIKQPKLCDICGDTFAAQYKLTIHRKKVHFSNPMQCTQCSRICNSERNLSRHMKRKHNEKKEFICATCGHSFAFRGELTNHINKVHKDRPKRIFTCKFCEKTFKCQKSIIIHERSAHTGERPAECSICFKGFFHEEYLKEHMRLHTGEAPYKCPICGRGYAQRGNMKSHLRIHRISEVDAATLSKMKPNYIKLLKI